MHLSAVNLFNCFWQNPAAFSSCRWLALYSCQKKSKTVSERTSRSLEHLAYHLLLQKEGRTTGVLFMSVLIRDPQCNVFSFFSAEYLYVGSRSRCSLLVKAIVCYLPLWKGKFVCFYLKTANASGIFLLLLFSFSKPCLGLPYLLSQKKRLFSFGLFVGAVLPGAFLASGTINRKCCSWKNGV